MSTNRTDALRRMVERNPDDPRARLGLAMELEKTGAWQDVVTHLQVYLAHSEDQGNAWGRLAAALQHLGRSDDARAAYEHGIVAARRHGHPSMAAEFEEAIEAME